MWALASHFHCLRDCQANSTACCRQQARETQPTALHSCSAFLRQRKLIGDPFHCHRKHESFCALWELSAGLQRPTAVLLVIPAWWALELKELKFLVVVHVHRWPCEKSESHLLFKNPVPKLWATDCLTSPGKVRLHVSYIFSSLHCNPAAINKLLLGFLQVLGWFFFFWFSPCFLNLT